MDNIWHALYPWTAQTPIPHTAKTNGHILLQQSIYSFLLVSVYILLYTVRYTDIYYFKKVYTRMYSYVLCISVYILLYTVIYTDIYYLNKVYTRFYSYVLCISVYILPYTVIYTDIYYFKKGYTRFYSYVFCISVYILLYTLIYTDIYYLNKVYTRFYSYVLCISVYILLITSPRDFLWDLDLSFSWNLMLSYILRCTFLRKQCYCTSADIRKLGYFITLMRGCPGSQLSQGFEINEGILRYATVHTLIYACFLTCIWTPLESWLPGQPLEIIHVCVYRLIYGSIALDFSYGKENEKNAILYWVYTGLYSVQISIYRYTTLYPWNLYIWVYTHMSK